MMSDNHESNNLQIEYGRSLAKFFMVIAGAQIALVGSLFSDYPHQKLAITAIILMILASLLAHWYSEHFVRAAIRQPDLKVKIFKWLYSKLSTSDDAAFFKGALASISFSLSAIMFIVYISN